MAQHHTPDQKATAVARVLAGESRRKVAGDMGVSDATVRRWMAQAESCETAQEQKLAEDAATIRARIERKQEEVRDLLLDRIRDLIPETEDLRAVATAFGIVTDKSLLTAGKPTGIHEHRSTDPLDVELEQLISEEAARRAAAGNGRA